MTFVTFSESEVRYRYQTAKNKPEMLRILAELTLSTEDEMAAFLGVEIEKEPRKKIDDKKAYALYRAGKGDYEMARELGVTRASVSWWRNSRGLPINSKRPKDNEMMAVYKSGLNDTDAAKALGISRMSFYKWRKTNGLKPNGKRRMQNE